MTHNQRHCLTQLVISIGFYLLITLPVIASAAQVTLQWDANDPAPEGYRLYQRVAGQTYNYNAPKWTGTSTTCTVSDLNTGTTYYYVVRAYQGSNESGDSNEVEFSAIMPAPGSSLDSDSDGVSDSLDAFPEDPAEWIDTDGDGIGNNTDSDDDGDGMPDSWETLYGLNPLVDDADADMDADGISNILEYHSGSDPSLVPGNTVPEVPILVQPADGAEEVDLAPILRTDIFSDDDNDTHRQTRYQISIADDFSGLVYERTSSSQLIRFQIPELILDPETTYYWRVKFVDSRNGASEWSEPFSFTTKTCEAAGDSDCDGILDDQEMEGEVDLDEDGTNDQTQAGLQGIHTDDFFNPQVAVKRLSENVQIVGMRALDSEAMLAEDNRPDQITGVISFKLNFLDAGTTTSVVIYFSRPAPDNAGWYKYDLDEGWQLYPHASFSADRMSVTITLEDGGMGDEDGVQNGIIVDPSGLGYTISQGENTPSFEPEDAASSGCFIGTVSVRINKRETK